MARINNTQLAVVLDKLSRFVTESVGDPEFSSSFNAGMETAAGHVLSGAGALDAYILSLDDVDIVADLLPPARVLDETHPTPPDGFLLNIVSVNNMIKALDAHFKAFDFKGLDDYMSQQNGSTPTIRAHGHFRKYLKTISAKNSFIPNDTVLATFAETGASTGTFAHLATIDKTQYAGAKLVAKNVGALTSSAVISVAGKKLDGTVGTLTATLATHTDAHETDLSDLLQLYVDVTVITLTSGGTNGDNFEIVAKSDRSIAAA